jgi:hypothetical protein
MEASLPAVSLHVLPFLVKNPVNPVNPVKKIGVNPPNPWFQTGTQWRRLGSLWHQELPQKTLISTLKTQKTTKICLLRCF